MTTAVPDSLARAPQSRRFGSLPMPVLAGIAAAWAAAIAAQAAGAAALVHHDALLVDGPSPVLATRGGK